MLIRVSQTSPEGVFVPQWTEGIEENYENDENENDVLFHKVTQAYSEKNPSAPIRSRT